MAEIRVKIIPEGIEELAAKLQAGVQKGVGGIGKAVEMSMKPAEAMMRGIGRFLPRQMREMMSGFTKGFMGAVGFGGLGGAVGGVMKGGVAGGGAVGGIAIALGIIVESIKGIYNFVMNLAPIRALIDVIRGILTIFFMPVAMMLMMIFMPFLMFFATVLKNSNIPAFVSSMMSVMKVITDIFVGIANFLGGDLKPIIYAIMVAIGVFMTALLSPILVIMAVITGISVVVGLIVKAINMIPWSDIVKAVEGVVNVIRDVFVKVYNVLSEVIGGILRGISNALSIIYGVLSDVVGKMLSAIKTAIDLVWNVLNTIYNWFVGIWNSIGGVFTTISSVLTKIYNFLNSLPHFQSGGYVANTGMAMLHAGEYVVPKGGLLVSGGSGGNVYNINVSVNVSGGMGDEDIRKMAAKIRNEIENSMKRVRGY